MRHPNTDYVQGRDDIVEYLVNEHAGSIGISRQDMSGWTAAHWAVGCTVIFALFIKQQAATGANQTTLLALMSHYNFEASSATKTVGHQRHCQSIDACSSREQLSFTSHVVKTKPRYMITNHCS